MLLQRLVEYSERNLAHLPARYTRTRVRYVIALREDGSASLVELFDGTTSGKQNRGKVLIAPTVARTAGIKPNLLLDNAEYVLGIARDPTKADKTPERHARFIEQVRDCAEATGESTVYAALRFLETGGARALVLPDDYDAAALIAFMVTRATDDIWPMALPRVQAYWATRNEVTDGETPNGLVCLVCGAPGPVEQTLLVKLRGIPDGQTVGTALISSNAAAFTSYGLRQTQNAPICSGCGEACSNALNDLIANPATSLRIGRVQYLFWTQEPSDVAWGDCFTHPDPQRLERSLPASAVSGFYAAALTANGGRAVVRDWIDTTIGCAHAQLFTYFSAQRLVDEWGQPAAPLSIWRLASATLRLDGQDRPIPADQHQSAAPLVVAALLRYALVGTPLPLSLLGDAVRRTCAEQRVLRERAAVIKLVLRSRDPTVGATWMDALEPANEAPAYLCGRVLAVIEQIQRAALGDVRVTAERFYATASIAPRTVFGRLLNGVQPQLATLRRTQPGRFRVLDSHLQEVMKSLQRFPALFSLEEQGLFALGYYHQRAEVRRRAQAHAALPATTPVTDAHACDGVPENELYGRSGA